MALNASPNGADPPVGRTHARTQPVSCTHPHRLVRPLLLVVIIVVIIVAAAEVAGEVGEEQEDQQHAYSQ